jgi:hypothetical protein
MYSILLSLLAYLRIGILRLILGGKLVYIDARLRKLRIRLYIAIENDSYTIRTFISYEN